MRAARIENGVVADLWEVPALDCYEGVTLVAAPDDVGTGWIYAGGVFIAPPPAAIPQPRTISTLAFRRRFAAKELAAITLAASRTLAAGDATLQVAIDDLNSASEVHLDNPEIVGGLDMLVASGLIDAERKSALLA